MNRRIDRGNLARHSGRLAERWAAWSLRLKGYRIVASNWRSPMGEIDLIAKRGRVLIFVEVKTRPTWALAAESIGVTQRARIERASQRFLQLRPDLLGLDLRYDVVLVTTGRWPSHIADAWRQK